jgi:DNA-binding transcriptional ArsR family regulator
MGGRVKPDTTRPEATPAEFKAMAHPLRLRILRLCLHESLTNKQIAEHLGQDPATTLYHVRMLVRTGFLVPEEVRTGRRGALEKPYRATRKSLLLAVPLPEDQMTSALAMQDALRAEIAEAGPEGLVDNARGGLQLSDDEVAELCDRLNAIFLEYMARPPTAGGTKYGLAFTVHRLRERHH